MSNDKIPETRQQLIIAAIEKTSIGSSNNYNIMSTLQSFWIEMLDISPKDSLVDFPRSHTCQTTYQEV
jgi:hypothetical protein